MGGLVLGAFVFVLSNLSDLLRETVPFEHVHVVGPHSGAHYWTRATRVFEKRFQSKTDGHRKQCR